MDVMPGYIDDRSLKDRQAVPIEQWPPLTLNLPLMALYTERQYS